MKRQAPLQWLDMSCKENVIVSVIIYLLFASCSKMTPPPLVLTCTSAAQTSSGQDG